jgi:hypothetical protein
MLLVSRCGCSGTLQITSRDYVVPVTLFIATRFPDGQVASYAIGSSFSVSVNFAAESG